MNIAHVVCVKLAITSLFLSAYNLFSCSVHATFTVTKILCTPTGMCGITFRYYNEMYEGFVVTNSTPPQFDLYYYPLSPANHCYIAHGSQFAGFLYMLAAIVFFCMIRIDKQRSVQNIEQQVLEVRPDQGVSIGYDVSSKTFVIITGP